MFKITTAKTNSHKILVEGQNAKIYYRKDLQSTSKLNSHKISPFSVMLVKVETYIPHGNNIINFYAFTSFMLRNEVSLH